jgi:micrococcal nuclease
MSFVRLLTGSLSILAVTLTPAFPQTLPAGLEAEGGAAKVVEVVDGDTVRLADGRQVRLVGTQAPKLALGRPNFTPWPLGEESKRALAALVQDRAVTLHYGGARQDRHGRALAHLVREDGLWIQGRMLREGLTRVYTFADNRAIASDLLALEQAARAAKRGIWSHPFYAIRTPEEAAKLIGTFQIVEGRVMAVAKKGERTYLNFGADWKSDFTVALDADAQRLVAQARLDPRRLEGRTVRVRGWLIARNGPMIELTHPEALESETAIDRPRRSRKSTLP